MLVRIIDTNSSPPHHLSKIHAPTRILLRMANLNILGNISFAEKFSLEPEAVRSAAGVERIGDITDRLVREFPPLSELAPDRLLKMVGASLRDSVRKRERLWLIPMDASAVAQWERWLGPQNLTRLGPSISAPVAPGEDCAESSTHAAALAPASAGENSAESSTRLNPGDNSANLQPGRATASGTENPGELTPIGIAPVRLIEALLDSPDPRDAALLRESLEEVDGLLLSARVHNRLIEAGVGIIPRNAAVRWITNPKVITYLVVLVYSALRALPVTFLPQFEGSVLLLWTIDLVTAIPYTWGILAIVTAARLATRIVGMIVTIATFMAPYIYFAAYGEDYPPFVWIIIGFLIACTFALEGYRWARDRRVSRQLRAVSGVVS